MSTDAISVDIAITESIEGHSDHRGLCNSPKYSDFAMLFYIKQPTSLSPFMTMTIVTQDIIDHLIATEH